MYFKATMTEEWLDGFTLASMNKVWLDYEVIEEYVLIL